MSSSTGTQTSLQHSDIESRLSMLKKATSSDHLALNKAVAQLSSCTGSLELHVKEVAGLQQPSRVSIAVELKSCGSYLEVARTKCTEPTTTPVWNEVCLIRLFCHFVLNATLFFFPIEIQS